MIKLIFQGVIPSKKNSKSLFRNSRTGKMFITSSKAYKEWNEEQQYLIKSQLNSQRAISPESPVFISYDFYAKDNRKFDLSNKVESINDLLVDIGFLEDDSWAYINGMNIRFSGVDKNNPHCEVLIERSNIITI